ncbi:MAG: ubiquinol-cytochrome c reductase iron-sulfur subunit [Gammaproteobacteria bacterium]
MDHDEDLVDGKRRRFLTAAATVVGGAGAAMAAVPFVTALQPSERARAEGGPIEVEIDQIEPGQMIRALWQGKPVWVVRRTPEGLKSLEGHDDALRDPGSEEPNQPPYATNLYRSIKPEYLILIGICTHLGCSPLYEPKGQSGEMGAGWQGGFFCPCHGSRFDLAGRVEKGVPAPSNLVVPRHRYLSDGRILVGSDEAGAGEADVGAGA